MFFEAQICRLCLSSVIRPLLSRINTQNNVSDEILLNKSSPKIFFQIIDTTTGEIAGVNKVGEVAIRGPHIMKGFQSSFYFLYIYENS